MKPICSLLLLALAFVSTAARAEAAPSKLQPADVFQLEYATDPQISPDGQQVVYMRNFMDIMKDRLRSTLWVIDADGGNHRAITDGMRNDGEPRWSPDGKRLAYLSKSDDGSFRIHVRWMDAGQTATLATLDTEPSGLAWSPDGKALAFSMLVLEPQKPLIEMPAKPAGAEWAAAPKVIRRVLYRADGAGYVKEGFHHLFLVPAEGGTPRQLTTGPYNHQGPLSWSPDGKAIAFSANRNADWEYQRQESEVYELAVTDGRLRKLTSRKGPDNSPVISPDGKRIAWVGYDDKLLSYQVTKLYVMNRDGTGRRLVTKNFDRDVVAPTWSRDGRGLYFQYDDRGVTKVGFATLDSDVRTLAENVGGTVLGRPYAGGSFSLARDGMFAYTQTRPEYPADVAVGHPKKKPRRVISLNDDLFGHKTLATTEAFWFESADKRKVQAWIVKPPGFDPKKKYPMILEIHGGPFANYGERFSAEIQLYAAAGYVVLYVNPAGSTGYGQQFGNLIHHAYPGRDYDDLMAAVDAVLARGYVDRDALFVTGGSGGGIMTAWIVGKTDRFRAAVSCKPVINWYSFALTSDIYPYFNKYWFPTNPWKDPGHYLRRSPISLVENVKTPTMLLTGEEDHRTPISESEQFYQALKLRKVDTMLVRVPGASHAIAKTPSHLIAKVAYILKWFEMHR